MARQMFVKAVLKTGQMLLEIGTLQVTRVVQVVFSRRPDSMEN